MAAIIPTPTTWTVNSKSVIQYTRSTSASIKFKYVVENTETHQKHVVLTWPELELPIVYDLDDEIPLSHFKSWYVCSNGYAYSTNQNRMAMHTMIAISKGIHLQEGESIDHINSIKLDNRRANLRAATQSQQNSNRETHSDKKEVAPELQDVGIFVLPKYIRYDTSEKKFVIDGHPKLRDDRVHEKRKSKQSSATKSKSATLVEKLADALARLNELNEQDYTNKEQFNAFCKQRDTMKTEYYGIVNSIRTYENQPPLELKEYTCWVTPKRRTEAGKKTVVNIPPEYGLSHGDLPSFCYYKKSEEKRKDGFEIVGHPGFKNIDGKQDLKKGGSWNVRRDIPPLQKRRIFLEKYMELQQAVGLMTDETHHTKTFLEVLRTESLL